MPILIGALHQFNHFKNKSIPHQFQKIISGPLVVGFCTSEQVQSLYFGKTETAQDHGLINFRRMGLVKPGEINLKPHCVA